MGKIEDDMLYREIFMSNSNTGGGGITPSGTKTITENGTYDVTTFASADVNVPSSGITPSGTTEITENGDYDVAAYANASVNVPVPDGYVKPHGVAGAYYDMNGEYTEDVTQFELIDITVDVPIPDGYIKPIGVAGAYYDMNGEYTEDVTERESIDITVDVPIPDGYTRVEGEIQLTENGDYDVAAYANASVNVPIPDGYVIPDGTTIINIDENGTVEQGVNDSANVRVNVNVHVPDDYVHVEGKIQLTENGDYDVSGYKSAYVYVPVPEGYVSPERYHGDITLVSQYITDFTSFCVAGEEGVWHYWLMARPGFSTSGGKDFTRCFADFPIITKSLPCSLNLIGAETTTNMFESSEYIENVEIVEGTIRHDISFVPIKCLQNASILSILKGLDTTLRYPKQQHSLRLPSMCFNGQTSSIILADTEMNTVYQAALTAGWTITFNLAD